MCLQPRPQRTRKLGEGSRKHLVEDGMDFWLLGSSLSRTHLEGLQRAVPVRRRHGPHGLHLGARVLEAGLGGDDACGCTTKANADHQARICRQLGDRMRGRT